MGAFYFGWLVVAASVVIYALVIGSTFAAFGLYVLPVSAEFGLSRADMNTGLIILNIGNAVIAPFVGRLLDRLPVKRIMGTCALLLGGSLVVLGLSHSLALDAAILALPVAAGVLGSGTISISIIIARWFSVYRGRAMALAAIGMALGSIVVAPIVGWLIETEGWRYSLITVGAFIGALMFAITLFLRERPGPDDHEVRDTDRAQQTAGSASNPEEVVAASAMSILRMRLFWALALGIGLGSAVNQGLMVSLVPIAVDSGLTTMQGASLISVSGVAGIASMLLLAVISDRLDRTVLLALLIASVALPCALLLIVESYAMLMVTAAVIGLSLAAATPLFLALLADRFGLAAFGTVRGLIVPVMSLLGAVSVRFIGEVFDRTGNYDAGLWTYLFVTVAAAALVVSTYPGRGRVTARVSG